MSTRGKAAAGTSHELEDTVLVSLGQGDADTLTTRVRGGNVDRLARRQQLEAAFAEECELRGISLHYHVHNVSAQPVSRLHGGTIDQLPTDASAAIGREDADEFEHWCSFVEPACMVRKALTGKAGDILQISQNEGGTYRLVVVESEDEFAFRIMYHLGQPRNGIGSGLIVDRPLKKGRCDLIVGLSAANPKFQSHSKSLAAAFSASITAHTSGKDHV